MNDVRDSGPSSPGRVTVGLTLGLLALAVRAKEPPAPAPGQKPADGPRWTAKEVLRLTGGGQYVHGVAISPDGRTALTTEGGLNWDGKQGRSYGCSARLWDLPTGRERARLDGFTGVAWSAAFSPDGTRALVGCGSTLVPEKDSDCVVRVWDDPTKKEGLRLVGHTAPVWQAVFSSDGARILTAAGGNRENDAVPDCTARLWDARTGKELQTLTGHTDRVNRAAFLPDHRAVTASSDNSLRVWDLRTGKELTRLHGHTEAVVALAVFPDGNRAVTGSFDNTLRLWDLKAGRELACWRGHDGLVLGVAVSPDSRLVASAGYDHSVRLWDVATGREVGRLLGHGQQVKAVAFAPDGLHLLSGSADRTARLWRLTPPAP
jgi:WD40 repeat protein